METKQWSLVCRKCGNTIDTRCTIGELRSIHGCDEISLEDDPQWCDECDGWQHCDLLLLTTKSAANPETLTVWMEARQ